VQQFDAVRHHQGAGRELKLPFTPVLAFAAKDGSFTRNLEQCNGCGGCRKETPTMCPTFLVTGEEIMSTRGRANAIRAALELRGVAGGDPLRSVELATEGLSIRTEILGPRHFETGTALCGRGGYLRDNGDYVAAERDFVQADSILRSTAGIRETSQCREASPIMPS